MKHLFSKRQNQSKSGKLKPNDTEKKRAKRIKDELAPTTGNTFLYQGILPSGLMQVMDNYFSQTYRLGDVNYQTVSLDDKATVMEKYSDLINSLDEQTNFQLTLFNRRINLAKFKQGVLYTHENDDYNHFRDELNGMMEANFQAGENNFITEKYISFGRKGSSSKQAFRSLSEIGEHFKSGFTEIEASFDLLSGQDRVNSLADILRGDHHLPFSYRDLELTGLTTRDFIAPVSLSFKDKNCIEIDDRYLQIVYIRDYGAELGDRFMRELIRTDRELLISLHAQAPEKAESTQSIKTKKGLIETQKSQVLETNAKNGNFSGKAGLGIETMLEEADDLIKTMTKTGDKLFNTTYLIGIFADSQDELKEAFEEVKRVASSNDLVLEKLTYMQEPALNALLPFGHNYLGDVTRSLLTSNIAVNSPWTSVDLQDRGGKYYGINQISNNIITLNRSRLNTPSGLILGTSGAGKGMAVKFEVSSTKLKNNDEQTEIIIVDPENEYGIIGQAFNGERIDIAPDSKTFINVLDLSEATADDDPIRVKSSFLLSWIGKLLNRQISAREKSVIDRVTHLTYRDFEQPTLKHWLFVLKNQPEQEAHQLAFDMELYVDGSLDIFAHETNVEVTNNFLIYNLKKLDEELKPVALMVIFDQIWNRVVRNQRLGVKTWIYFDEMQLLLDDQYASDFFFKLWSRVRKYGGVPTGITQNVETLLLDPNGRRIIANSEFMILLKQAKNDREELVHMLGLSAELEKYLKNPDKGAGLIKAGGTVVPFKNKIPEHLSLFQMMSTEPNNMSQ
ncbi:VirB4-like conjugal transfer ATPase, CD1110 family [Streptococcus sp. E17BB]|uniref:VirB4-like conjugal transfer ATPase, CD1110 family n=1 Tax=Streptococcus sp. E17BB TaxID=3278714 RepID=UPI00359CBB85